MIALALLIQAATPPAAPDATMLPYADMTHRVTIGDGRHVGLYCTGPIKAGRPTVILTAGATAWGASWRLVQPAVAARFRVCTWDRAGVGLSDPSTAVQDVAATTADLAAALKAGGVAPPYLLVGHSIGSYETLRFADEHRREVWGMVLVDPSLPDQFARFARVGPDAARLDAADLAEGIAEARRCGAALRAGVAAQPCLTRPATEPPALAALLRDLAADPARHDTVASFLEAMPASATAIVRSRDYGTMPLVVLTAAIGMSAPDDATPAVRDQVAAMQAAWVAGHDALARLSRRGVNRTVADTGHMIPARRPDAIVAAIDEVAAAGAMSRGR